MCCKAWIENKENRRKEPFYEPSAEVHHKLGSHRQTPPFEEGPRRPKADCVGGYSTANNTAAADARRRMRGIQQVKACGHEDQWGGC